MFNRLNVTPRVASGTTQTRQEPNIWDSAIVYCAEARKPNEQLLVEQWGWIVNYAA